MMGRPGNEAKLLALQDREMQRYKVTVYHRSTARWVGEIRDGNWYTVLQKVRIPYVYVYRLPIYGANWPIFL